MGCYLCVSSFRNLAALNRHLKRAHGESVTVLATFTCPQCKAGLSSPANLERHIKTVHKDGASSVASQVSFSESTDNT